MSTARDLGTTGEDNTYGWGVIDAYQAVLAVYGCNVAASFSGTPTNGCAPLTVQFTDLSTGPVISWDWDFGDGTAHSSLQNPSHQYQNAGTYTVTLKATSDSCSDVETKTNYITVSTTPVANFVGNPTSGSSPLTVNFTDQSTGNPTAWDWNFGDGTPHSYVRNPSHTYNNPGDYTVTLIAANNCGSDTETKVNYIHVTAGPYIYSSSIVVSRIYDRKANNYYGKAVITVLDQNGGKVLGAMVSAHWSGLTSDSDQGTTNHKGQVTFYSDRRTAPHCGYFVENVDNIVKSGYWYNSGVGETKDSVYSCVSAKALAGIPEEFEISQNYPNPFNPATQFSLTLPEEVNVSIVIYNLVGQKVRTLVNETMGAGTHIITWDGTTDDGEAVSTGVYFYQAVAGENVVTKKMMLVK
jgi:PKD repeat protein